MSGLGERIYARLPRVGQDLAATGFGLYRHWLRFGPGYGPQLEGYRRREHWSAQALDGYRQSRLRELLELAAARIPYYRDVWTDAERRAVVAGRLDALPLLEKGPIREAPWRFARDDLHPFWRSVFHTSGSTGTPIATWWTPLEIRHARALREARSANWAGVSFGLPRATFSGRLVVPDPNSRGPFHRFNRVEGQVYFSAFHLSATNAPQYVEALHCHGTRWLTGYAQSFYLLARHILDQDLVVPPLQAVVTTSEKLTAPMRQTMEQAYRCRVFEEYSTVENAVFASECEQGRLHLSCDAGVLEILRPDGSCCGPSEVGEVVTTSFVRTYQPFIRYRLGDFAAWDDEPCPCGRALPTLREVVGRTEDVVLTPDGRETVRFHGVFVDQPHVVERQVIQEALDCIRIRIVPAPGFGPADEAELERRVMERLGRVRVTVESVAAIPRTGSGKFQAVVSLLARR